MDEYGNIKYYFYCRHQLGIKPNQIATEISDLFRVKIPVREGLTHWADCINTNSTNIFNLFKYNSAHKKCFKHLSFELKSSEPNDTQEMQFYALCRFQLNVRAAQVSDELKTLYARRAPSLLCLHTWLISCLKKETNSNDYEEIDLTNEEVVLDDSFLNDNNNNKNKNETTIKFYFYCRNKFNLKLPDIFQEMKTLFERELLPKSIGSLYNWQKSIKNGLDLFNYDASSRALYSNLNFELDAHEENRVQRVQFYALCRYQLSGDVARVLDELKKLFGAQAPSLGRLESWISNLIKKKCTNMMNCNEEEEEKDALIEQLKSELSSRMKTYEQSLFSKQLEIREKDALIEQLREELNEKQFNNSSETKFLNLGENFVNLKRIFVETLNQSENDAQVCQLKRLEEAVKMQQIESNETKLKNYQAYQTKSKNLRWFYMKEIRKLKERNLKLNARLENEMTLNKSILSEIEQLKSKLNEYKMKQPSELMSSYQAKISSLEQNVAKLTKKLDESYEFLIEKETNYNKVNQDIDVFEHKLSLVLASSVESLAVLDLSNENVQLYDCLLRVRAHLESRHVVKKFENNQCKIVHRVLDVNQLRQLEYLQQIKLFKTSKP